MGWDIVMMNSLLPVWTEFRIQSEEMGMWVADTTLTVTQVSWGIRWRCKKQTYWHFGVKGRSNAQREGPVAPRSALTFLRAQAVSGSLRESNIPKMSWPKKQRAQCKLLVSGSQLHRIIESPRELWKSIHAVPYPSDSDSEGLGPSGHCNSNT